ncbi:hypothetical protein [Curtobacterium sp. MCLR17_054]|uniref:hypothetical protein n=1 Tax=Curtobacterium sp. MCLR17_054 TaxID=2175632 RepID=UPI000DA76E61|nr:hypothetical protein [Curtobacterium sp. MCLR17_054]WIE70298.1 hypothetical protein DEJ08_018125 [Curtobacterium sp. MCLR17_054]
MFDTNPDAAGTDSPKVWTVDPRWVQPADLTACDAAGCTATAVPEGWALIDLDTGEELPGRLCETHERAHLTHP